MNKIISTILIVLFFNISSAKAGGDYWSGKLQHEIIDNKPIVIKLLLKNPRGLIDGCDLVIVKVEIPQLSFFSLFHLSSSHPTKKETIEAIYFLNKNYKNSKEIYFGYIGRGLIKESVNNCIFKSRGLRIEEITKNKKIVFSFFDPI